MGPLRDPVTWPVRDKLCWVLAKQHRNLEQLVAAYLTEACYIKNLILLQFKFKRQAIEVKNFCILIFHSECDDI